ncbi:hypothetical protein ACIQYS_12900 [Psychrobacillus sp. NPDC096426]|uniref:anti-sigma factor domain-containing protein n=1 Tax=Psychrobacillus sp. NPDC096426 TaxID=3364491 RepID=UPI003819B7E0
MMRTYKGIVCDKKNEYIVFLTKEGEFLHGTPIGPTPEVGEEAEFQLVAVPMLHRKRIKPFFVGSAIVAAVLLLFVIASLIPQTSNAYAYVQLEGKTTVKLGVDERGNVVSLRSLDETTPFNLDEWEGLSINVVLAKAMAQLRSTNEEIVITTVYEKQDEEELKKRIDQAVNEVQKQTPQKIENTKPIIENKPVQKETPPAVEHKHQEKEPDPHKTKEQPRPDNGPNRKEKHQEIKHHEKQQEKKHHEKHHNQQEKQQEKWEKKKEKQEEKAQDKQHKEDKKAEKQREKNERNKKDDDENDHDD